MDRNLELKARVASLDKARAALPSLPIRSKSVELQTDTYFRAPNGRLKLREIEGRRAELIWYLRPDREAAGNSEYRVVGVEDPAGLREALQSALGERGQVRKRREIHLWHNVRIHLDDVDGLGSFIEFEAVLRNEDDRAQSADRLSELCTHFDIRPDDRIAVSYSDLLLGTSP